MNVVYRSYHCLTYQNKHFVQRCTTQKVKVKVSMFCKNVCDNSYLKSEAMIL